MAIGEIAAFLNSNLDEPLDELIERKFSALTAGQQTAQTNPYGIKVYAFGTDDIFPYTHDIDKGSLAVIQRRYADSIVPYYESCEDDFTVDDGGSITINAVRPFPGRIITTGADRVRTVIFTKEDVFPLHIPPEQTGQHQWVMMPVCDEKSGSVYIRRHDALTVDADGGITINALRPFDGRVLIAEGA